MTETGPLRFSDFTSAIKTKNGGRNLPPFFISDFYRITFCGYTFNIEHNVAALFEFSASDKELKVFVVFPFIVNIRILF